MLRQVVRISIHILFLVTRRRSLSAHKCFVLVYTSTSFVRVSDFCAHYSSFCVRYPHQLVPFCARGHSICVRGRLICARYPHFVRTDFCTTWTSI